MTRVEDTFDPIAQTTHWVMALAIFSMIIVGAVMTDDLCPPEIRGLLFTSHKTVGVLIFFLAIFRLYWRTINPPPPLPIQAMPRWQYLAAKTVHHSLYALTILIPLEGWMMVSAGSYGIKLFGILPIPNVPFISTAANKTTLLHTFQEGHETLVTLLAVLVVLHIGGTMLHHFVDRDNILIRITPSWSHPFLNRIRGL